MFKPPHFQLMCDYFRLFTWKFGNQNTFLLIFKGLNSKISQNIFVCVIPQNSSNPSHWSYRSLTQHLPIIISNHLICISMVRHKETSDLDSWLGGRTWWIFWFIHNLRRTRQPNLIPWCIPLVNNLICLVNCLILRHLIKFDHALIIRVYPVFCWSGGHVIVYLIFILGSRSILDQPCDSWSFVDFLQK